MPLVKEKPVAGAALWHYRLEPTGLAIVILQAVTGWQDKGREALCRR